MSSNDEFITGNFGDSLQLTNWILDSGATCHMTPEVSYFIPGTLEDTDKHIEVADGHHVTAKQKVQSRIKMCDGHVYPFITMLHNRTYLFIPQRVLHCVLWRKRENAVSLPHSAQRKHAFIRKIKEMSKKKKLPS